MGEIAFYVVQALFVFALLGGSHYTWVLSKRFPKESFVIGAVAALLIFAGSLYIADNPPEFESGFWLVMLPVLLFVTFAWVWAVVTLLWSIGNIVKGVLRIRAARHAGEDGSLWVMGTAIYCLPVVVALIWLAYGLV